MKPIKTIYEIDGKEVEYDFQEKGIWLKDGEDLYQIFINKSDIPNFIKILNIYK